MSHFHRVAVNGQPFFTEQSKVIVSEQVLNVSTVFQEAQYPRRLRQEGSPESAKTACRNDFYDGSALKAAKFLKPTAVHPEQNQ